MTAFNMALTGLILWVMAYPGIAQEAAVLRALYYLGFAIGGVGFSVPMGLLIAGLSVPAAIMKLLPKWLVVSGFALGIIGELSAHSGHSAGVVSNPANAIPRIRLANLRWF